MTIDHNIEAKTNPTAYAGSVVIDGVTLTIAEAANRFSDIPPIISRFGNWVISNDGSIGCLETYYFIDKDRVHEPDWSKHVGSKKWVNKADFDNALKFARSM